MPPTSGAMRFEAPESVARFSKKRKGRDDKQNRPREIIRIWCKPYRPEPKLVCCAIAPFDLEERGLALRYGKTSGTVRGLRQPAGSTGHWLARRVVPHCVSEPWQ